MPETPKSFEEWLATTTFRSLCADHTNAALASLPPQTAPGQDDDDRLDSDAEQIEKLIRSTMDMSNASVADWIWETLAVVEARQTASSEPAQTAVGESELPEWDAQYYEEWKKLGPYGWASIERLYRECRERQLREAIAKADMLTDQLNAAMIGQRERQKQFEKMADMCDEAIAQRDEVRKRLEYVSKVAALRDEYLTTPAIAALSGKTDVFNPKE